MHGKIEHSMVTVSQQIYEEQLKSLVCSAWREIRPNTVFNNLKGEDLFSVVPEGITRTNGLKLQGRTLRLAGGIHF